jgi:hypothetical protein
LVGVRIDFGEGYSLSLRSGGAVEDLDGTSAAGERGRVFERPATRVGIEASVRSVLFKNPGFNGFRVHVALARVTMLEGCN